MDWRSLARDEAICDEAMVIDLRSLALRDEAMALDEAAVLMLLWKLAPISDISKVVSQQRCYVPESQNMRAN